MVGTETEACTVFKQAVCILLDCFAVLKIPGNTVKSYDNSNF